jgi:hypothetical protein
MHYALWLLILVGAAWAGYKMKQWGLTILLTGVAIGTMAPNVWIGTSGLIVAVIGVAIAAKDVRRVA